MKRLFRFIYLKKRGIEWFILGLVFLYVLLLPIVFYIPKFNLLCNVVEYGLIGCICLYLPFSKERLTKVSFLVIPFVIFVIYSSLHFLVFSDRSLSNVLSLVRLLYPFFLLFGVYVLANTKARKIALLLVVIGSIYLMFIYSFLTTPFSNLIQAFSGGRYRLGNAENQANGYAVYCTACILSSIFLYSLTGKLRCLWLAVVPAFMCIGTQSLKGFLIVGLEMVFIVYLWFRQMRKMWTKVLLGCSLFALLAFAIILAIRIGAFVRILNWAGGSGSLSERINMYAFAALNSEKHLLFGHGLGAFPGDFESYYGNSIIFHSSSGDVFYSYGLFGLVFWCFFVYKVCISSHYKGVGVWLGILVFSISIIMDFSAQIWLTPISFLLFGAFLSIRNNSLFYSPASNGLTKKSGIYRITI